MEYYEAVLFHSKHNKTELLNALNVVRKFIKSRKLVLYGGISIDYAMRLKGQELYSDNIFPDYDFLSTDPIKDSYDLVEILYKNGIVAQAINAFHPQTMRVRVDFEVVADISYIPKIIFDNLPTMKYDKLLFISPSWQIIDMHMSMTYPYADPGKEFFLNRFKKDNTRYQILYDLWVKDDHANIIKKSQLHIENKKLNTEYRISDYSITKKSNVQINSGIVGYGLCTLAYLDICRLVNEPPSKIYYPQFSKKNGIDYMKFKQFVPSLKYVFIVKDLPDIMLDKNIPKIGELKSETCADTLFEFYKSDYHMLYSIINIGEKNYTCSTIHFIMKYFLVEYFLNKFGHYGESMEVPEYIELYENCLIMIKHVESLLINDDNDKKAVFLASPFSPITDNIMLTSNCNLRCKITEDKLSNTLDKISKKYIEPKNYYFDKNAKDYKRPNYTFEETDTIKKYIMSS